MYTSFPALFAFPRFFSCCLAFHLGLGGVGGRLLPVEPGKRVLDVAGRLPVPLDGCNSAWFESSRRGEEARAREGVESAGESVIIIIVLRSSNCLLFGYATDVRHLLWRLAAYVHIQPRPLASLWLL